MGTTTLSRPVQWLIDWFAGDADSDGGRVSVSNETMLSSAAIWYCMTTISGDVAKMPLFPMRELPNGGSEKLRRHPTYRMMIDAPNGFQTADIFKEQITAHALAWGNGRAYIHRVDGVPVELIPLRPDLTDTYMVDGRKIHVTSPDGDDPIYQVIGDGNFSKLVAIPDEDVLHIQGFGYTGYKGKSLAAVARDSIGTDLQAQRYQRRQMAKGMSSKIMLEDQNNVLQSEDDVRKFLDAFRDNYSNEKKGEVAGMLRAGMKASVLQMSNVDAQFIQQRTFSRQDVMLWFGMQHIPGDNSSVSYNSLEQKQLAYLASCLDRWLCKWEMQCDAKLRTEREKVESSVYYRYDRETWIQTDIGTQADVLVKLVGSKILNRNEARDTIHRNPVEGGDVFENPAIQVNEPAEERDDAETQNNAIQTRLNQMIAIEGKRAIQAAKNPQSFMKWLDEFTPKWSARLAELATELGVSSLAITAQHEHRYSQLLDTMDCKPDEFLAAVESLVGTWNKTKWSW
jgi:HK97 family phage portal protein